MSAPDPGYGDRDDYTATPDADVAYRRAVELITGLRMAPMTLIFACALLTIIAAIADVCHHGLRAHEERSS